MLLSEALKILNGNKRPDQHSTGGTGEPWYTRDAIEILERTLKPHFKAFEYGAGASTIWIAHRVSSLVAVEHNPNWYHFVTEAVQLSDLEDKVTVRHEKLGAGYSDVILEFEDESFDAVFIDGRERAECTTNAVPKVRSGGIVCIDNTEREHYRVGTQLMNEWDKQVTVNEKGETTIWTKPGRSQS